MNSVVVQFPERPNPVPSLRQRFAESLSAVFDAIVTTVAEGTDASRELRERDRQLVVAFAGLSPEEQERRFASPLSDLDLIERQQPEKPAAGPLFRPSRADQALQARRPRRHM